MEYTEAWRAFLWINIVNNEFSMNLEKLRIVMGAKILWHENFWHFAGFN